MSKGKCEECPDPCGNHLDVFQPSIFWYSSSELIDFGIKYIEDGWYEGEFGEVWDSDDVYQPDAKFAYVLHDDGTFLTTVWSFDPRPLLRQISEAEVRT